ncbi:MAG TPA: serine/threonine-protein kinase [Actinomycetota bacterium]|nr:serine/threonine-protein kinase [Actinomycetota bacterium]
MNPTGNRIVADGRYELEEVIGHGGMGTVWRARDTVLGRTVALKHVEIPGGVDDADREQLRERVMREARAAARLNHSAALTVYDVIPDDDAVFIALELAEAPTLEDVVKDGGPLSAEETAHIGAQIADVLAHAHGLGIVHRDVKPSNIIVTDAGAKLADFGIATMKGDARLTATGIVVGSPSFMAPEQAMGEPAGPETDVWGLGATLFFAASGEMPFDKGNAVATLAEIVGSEAPTLAVAGPLSPLITELMSKQPEARPEISAVKARLSAIAAGELAGATQPSTQPYTQPETAVIGAQTEVEDIVPAPAPAVRREVVHEDPSSSSPWGWAIAIAAVLLIAGFAWLALRDGEGENNPRERRNERAGGGQNADEQEPADTAPEDDGDDDDAEDGEDDAPVSEGGSVYENAVGWTIEHPAEWAVTEDPLGDSSSTRFEDPSTSTYLLVDWQSPPGDDAVASAEAQEESFADSHDGYERVAMDGTEYQGMEAVHWEYVYEDGGALLHAINLQFIDGEDYGFALNFQAAEEDWETVLPLFDVFKESFRAP